MENQNSENPVTQAAGCTKGSFELLFLGRSMTESMTFTQRRQMSYSNIGRNDLLKSKCSLRQYVPQRGSRKSRYSKQPHRHLLSYAYILCVIGNQNLYKFLWVVFSSSPSVYE